MTEPGKWSSGRECGVRREGHNFHFQVNFRNLNSDLRYIVEMLARDASYITIYDNRERVFNGAGITTASSHGFCLERFVS